MDALADSPPANDATRNGWKCAANRPPSAAPNLIPRLRKRMLRKNCRKLLWKSTAESPVECSATEVSETSALMVSSFAALAQGGSHLASGSRVLRGRPALFDRRHQHRPIYDSARCGRSGGLCLQRRRGPDGLCHRPRLYHAQRQGASPRTWTCSYLSRTTTLRCCATAPTPGR